MKKHEMLLSNKNEQTKYIDVAVEAGIRGGMVGTDLVVFQNKNSGMTYIFYIGRWVTWMYAFVKIN